MKTLTIETAVQALKQGQLVIIPTETVYGLAADAQNEAAIQAIFKVKNRPNNHPLILHLATIDELKNWAVDIPEVAYQLAQQYWPGPLTLVLKKHPSVSSLITGGQSTVAIRIPNHPVALELLQQLGSGLVAPSANLFTQISPTSCQLAKTNFNPNPAEIAGILEGGPCDIGIESTILDCTQNNNIKVLRHGLIAESEIFSALNVTQAPTHEANRPVVSGSHEKHYAPNIETYLIDHAFLQNGDFPEVPFSLITFSKLPINNDLPKHSTHYLLPSTLKACAQALYQTLFDAQQQKQLILIEACPFDAIEWASIIERLTKAASGQYYPNTATIKA